MFDYDSIKDMAKSIGRPVTDFLAMSSSNDPFYAGVASRRNEAEWFAKIWHDFGFERGMHLRRIHYRLLSAKKEGQPILRPNGREYLNTDDDWKLLARASLSARYLDLIPFDDLVDNRNDAPIFFTPEPHWSDGLPAGRVHTSGNLPDMEMELPDDPGQPRLWAPEIKVEQDYIVEVWIEKSTQNDWLVNFCRNRGINLQIGAGEFSETRSRELALRCECGKPVRVVYLSGFDPGGRSMPKAVARKVEFTIARFGLGVDAQLIPLALAERQCIDYELPRTPIKITENRRGRFEETFGQGATELDALEALHPGELKKLLCEEVDKYLGPTLNRRRHELTFERQREATRIERAVLAEHQGELDALLESHQHMRDYLESTAPQREEQAAALWETMGEKMRDQAKDLPGIEPPAPDREGETDKFVLFDPGRDFFAQTEEYQRWKDGGE